MTKEECFAMALEMEATAKILNLQGDKHAAYAYIQMAQGYLEEAVEKELAEKALSN